MSWAEAQIIYVKMGGSGNGSSWERPMGDLQAALRMAHKGTQIWVATGVYQPTNTGDRFASFNIPDGVQLFGGFAGFETSIDQRNLADQVSVLSGEIGAPGFDDNSYTVVFTRNAGEQTIIDGFEISGGAANGMGDQGDVKRCGGAWFNQAYNGASKPVIRNCVFRENIANDGAALYNQVRGGEASPRLMNCTFVFNRAELDGGAVYNEANQGLCSPVIENCLFQENQASYGAGIMNQSAFGEVRPIINNCHFIANISLVRGSGFYNNRLENGICAPVVQNCIFEENIPGTGIANVNKVGSPLLADDRPATTGYRK